MGVCGIFASHFCRKKAVCNSCLVLGCVEPRPHWVQKGRGLDVLSRLKGIETGGDDRCHTAQTEFGCAFPFEGN